MIRPAGRPRLPGRILLRIARLVVDDRLFSAVVHPTIADLQREVADAGPSALERLRARRRGYVAFWTLVLVASFASVRPAALRVADAGAVAFPDALARLAGAAIFVAVLAVIGPAFGARVALVAAAGALFAILIHAWYDRHPSEIPEPGEPQSRTPQINFSSTEVAGNIGGLIFVVGSLFVVTVGLPSVIWFLVAATIAGCFLAWARVSWHRSHPDAPLPRNRVVFR
jgi:hypothetical protein